VLQLRSAYIRATTENLVLSTIDMTCKEQGMTQIQTKSEGSNYRNVCKLSNNTRKKTKSIIDIQSDHDMNISNFQASVFQWKQAV